MSADLKVYPTYQQGLDDVAELTRMLVAHGRGFELHYLDDDDGNVMVRFQLAYVSIEDVRVLDAWTRIQPAARRMGFAGARDYICYVSVRWRGEGVE